MSVVKTTPGWVRIWITFFLLLGSIPVVTGKLMEPEGKLFTGVIYNTLDVNSYLANMQQGREGHWLYVLPYTAQRSTPVPLFMFYILLGHAARITTLSLPAIFHIARIVCGGVFALTAYHFIAHYLQQEAERKVAFGLLLFTGGLSWLVIAIFGSNLSQDLHEIPDYWISDAVSFLAMINNGHFTLIMTFMMWLILAGEEFFQRGNAKAWIPTLFSGIGIAFIHPQQLAVVGMIVVLSWLLRCRDAQRFIWWEGVRIGVVFVPVALVAGVLTFRVWQDDLLKSWLAQNFLFSPPLWSVVFILYGPAFWLAVGGATYIARHKEKTLYPIALWFIITLVLIYVPGNFQRRFMEGWHIPVVILAAVAWQRIAAPWLTKYLDLKTARAIGMIWSGSLVLTPLVVLSQGLLPAINPDDSPAYIDQDTYQALLWIRTNAEGNDVVIFTGFDNGNLIPAWTTARTTLGHWSLTAFAADRWNEPERFFSAATTDTERIALLRNLHVDYVYVSDSEREFGSFVPESADYLEPVFTSDTTSIYRFDIE